MRETIPAGDSGRQTIQPHSLRVLVAIALLGALACSSGSDSTTGPAEDVAGVYTLQRIEGTAVPVQVYRGQYFHVDDGRMYQDFRATITDGWVELDDSGTYFSVLNYRVLKDGIEENGELDALGTYEVKGNQLILTSENGEDQSIGKIQGGSVTLYTNVVAPQGNEKPYVYTK